MILILSKQVRSMMLVIARYLAWLARLNLGKLESDLIRQKQYILTWRFYCRAQQVGLVFSEQLIPGR